MDELLSLLSSIDISKLIQNLIYICGVFGIVIDVTPWVKFNPIRWVFSQIGRLLNGERFDKLETEITQLKTEVKQNRYDQDQNRIKDIRKTILDFANSIPKRERDMDEINEIFDLDQEYIVLLKKYNMLNGRTDRAMDKIRKYHDKLVEQEIASMDLHNAENDINN